jgi:hypothetical protein
MMKASQLKAIASAVALFVLLPSTAVRAQTSVTPADARVIAKEAYIYGYPMVDSYRIQHAYFVDTKNPEYKGPWNQLISFSRVFTPEDKAVQTPNSDTPYSFLGMDLRAEPIVLTVPAIEKDRYFSIQLIDAYTFNFAYIGSRATGNDGGSYLIAGPGWKGEAPKGVKKVIRAETELVLGAYRTQLINAADIDNVKKVQAGYKVQTLSAFLGQPAPKAAPAIDFIAPLTPETQKTSLQFFNVLNFVLQYCPTNPSETELMTRFATINVGGGKTFDAAKLSPEMKTAMEQGMADAWVELANLEKKNRSVDRGRSRCRCVSGRVRPDGAPDVAQASRHASAASTASVSSSVVAVPPRSAVRDVPSAVTASTASSTAAAASASPRWSSIMLPVHRAAIGLAIPCPAMSGADPWTGSNMLGWRRCGLMLPPAATPIPPTTAGPRSDRRSPNRVLATMTSKSPGRSTMCAVMMSMWNWSVPTSGNSAAMAAKRSSQ